jgi:hypothetical protein
MHCSLDELPMYNWEKATQNKELKYLCKGFYTFSEPILTYHLDKLNAEFIDTFGISDNYRRYLLLLIELETLKIDHFVSQNRSILTFIKLKEIEIEQLQTEMEVQGKAKTIDVNVYVSKFMQTYINKRKVSVVEYYNMIKAMEKEYGKN